MITDETPIAHLNVGQLKMVIKEINPENTVKSKRFVYGLKGICEIFSCGVSRAQELKKTVISDAVSQQGRTIVTDVDFALQLFARSSQNKNINEKRR